LTQLTLASIRTQQNEIDEACRVGRDALNLAAAVRSIRVRDALQSLRKDLSPFSAKHVVREFDMAARQVLAVMQ